MGKSGICKKLISVFYENQLKKITKFNDVQVRSARAVEDLQRKELEDQLEAEAYFSGLYKTQVNKFIISILFFKCFFRSVNMQHLIAFFNLGQFLLHQINEDCLIRLLSIGKRDMYIVHCTDRNIQEDFYY